MEIKEKFTVNNVTYTVKNIVATNSNKEYKSVKDAINDGVEEKYIYINNQEYDGWHQWSWLKKKLSL